MKTGPKYSHKKVLQDMLIPRSLIRSRDPFVVAASPLSWREAARSGGGFRELRRTLSDHVGIRGLLHAFGVILHRSRDQRAPLLELPELLDPNDFRDEVVTENQANQPAHLYCIGSPKANRWSRIIMQVFNECWSPNFEFRADDLSEDLRNVAVQIHKGRSPYLPDGFTSTSRQDWDLGLVIRGPNPFNERCLITLLAGRSALGTEAACYAVTNIEVLSIMHRRLSKSDPGWDVGDHKQAFFASVHMKRDESTKQSDPRTLKIAETGFFRRLAGSPQVNRKAEFDIFLSHHGAERTVAQKLAHQLQTRGISVWFSESQIALGERWLPQLEKGLDSTRGGLLLVGSSGVGPWQMMEWEILLKRSFTGDYPLIPVYLPGVRVDALPKFMPMLQTFVLAEGFRKNALDILARRIRQALSKS